MSYDVGILAQDRAQGVRERMRVRVELALIDKAPFVRMEVLDRVLDRHHVLVTLAVDLVEHRGEGRRLPRTGRPGHQDQAPRPIAQARDDIREAQLFEVPHLPRDGSNAPATRRAGRTRWRGTGPVPSRRREIH